VIFPWIFPPKGPFCRGRPPLVLLDGFFRVHLEGARIGFFWRPFRVFWKGSSLFHRPPQAKQSAFSFFFPKARMVPFYSDPLYVRKVPLFPLGRGPLSWLLESRDPDPLQTASFLSSAWLFEKICPFSRDLPKVEAPVFLFFHRLYSSIPRKDYPLKGKKTKERQL